MSGKREATQFSKVQYEGYMGQTRNATTPVTTRDLAMDLFTAELANKDSKVNKLGGLKNIRNVRVYDLGEGKLELEYGLFMPVDELRKREVQAAKLAARNAKKQAQKPAPAKPAAKPQPKKPTFNAKVERLNFLKSEAGKEKAYELMEKTMKREQEKDAQQGKKFT